MEKFNTHYFKLFEIVLSPLGVVKNAAVVLGGNSL